MKKHDRFQFLGSGIRRKLTELVPDTAYALVMLRKDWPLIAQKTVALHSYPYSLGQGGLLILVDDPIWLSELALLKDDLLNSIHQYLSRQRPVKIESLRFRLGPIPATEQAREPKTRLRLPAGKLDAIEDTIKHIEDEELKSALRHYFIQISLEETGVNTES